MKYGTDTAEQSSALFSPIHKLSKTPNISFPHFQVKVEPNTA